MLGHCIVLCLFVSCAFSDEVKKASVILSSRTGKYEILDYIADNAIAYGTYQDETFQTGWAYLDLKTRERFPDSFQAYAAGLLEGHLTRDIIKDYWFNVADEYCDGEEEYCWRLEKFLLENMEYIRENIRKRAFDEYWHQVALTLVQLHGLEDGYKNRISAPSTNVDVMGLLLLSLMGDFLDLEKVLGRKNPQSMLGSGSCSAIIKVLPDKSDIYFTHVSWTGYSTMLRILKKYTLNFHRTSLKGSPLVPGQTSSFPSRPGVIFSMDDFYLISSGLCVMETTIGNQNADLWKYVKPRDMIFEWQRNVIANRLAEDGKQWVDCFSKLNSGTYNNQFMVLDYNKFTPGKDLEDGLLHVVEQLPGHIRSDDVTYVLRRQDYWPSYNLPYFADIFNMSDMPRIVRENGDLFDYDKCPRARMFRRDQGKVTDVESLIKLMRYNDYTHDPISRCNCTPPYTANYAISARNDLNPVYGSFPLPALAHQPVGGIDMKLTTSKMFKNYEFVAIGGPTYDQLPPFQWSKTDFDKTIRHRGQPDLWKFEPVTHKWD